MAYLPVLLDIVDEMYTGLDDQSKVAPDMSNYFNNFPFFFMPQQQQPTNGCGQGMRFRRGPTGGGCHFQKGAGCQFPKGTGCQRRGPFPGKGQCTGGNCVAKPSEDFKVSVDVKSFKPEEISVKVKDREILIEGKHEERADEFGYISRQFARRYVLPEEFDVDTVSTFLNAEGQMTIKAMKPQPAAVEGSERIIPIQRIPSDVTTTEQEQGWENVDEAKEEKTAGESSQATH